MMRLTVYLSRTFLFLWGVVTFGFLMLIGLLDSLANGSDILADGRGFTSTFEYMAYRAPVIFDRILLFTIVVGILLTYVKLLRNHELVALLGLGLSVPVQIAMLTPIVVGVTTVSIFVINSMMPPSVRALQAWGIGEYRRTAISDTKPLWLRDGMQIVRAAGRDNMVTLNNLQFFDTNEAGEVTAIHWVDKATYNNEYWDVNEVKNVTTKERFTPAPMKVWISEQTPTSIANLAADPRDLALADMRKFRVEGNSGSKPSFAYAFWYLHRLTRPLAAFILLMCCVPIMQRTGREQTGDNALIIGITVGFIYLILDGALSTFAVTGGISVGWAVALPLAIFAIIGGFLCLNTETL